MQGQKGEFTMEDRKILKDKELDKVTGGTCEYFIYQDYGHTVCDEAPDFRQRMLDFLHKIA